MRDFRSTKPMRCSLLIRRAGDLQSAKHAASLEEELDCVSDVVAAYEAKRWQDGSKLI